MEAEVFYGLLEPHKANTGVVPQTGLPGWGRREKEIDLSLHAVMVFRGNHSLLRHQIEAQCPLKWRMGGSVSLFGRFGKEKNLLLLPE